MNAAVLLPRLFLRPLALWNGFVVAGLACVVGMLAFVVRGGVQQPSALDSTATIVRQAELQLALGAVLIPSAFGTAIAWHVFELLLCPWVAATPGVARRLLFALVAAGLVVAGLTAWWCDEQPGHQVPPLFLALAFLCFALAVSWSDPWYATWGGAAWLLQPVAWAPIFLAPELVRAFETVPWVLGPLAFVLGCALLAAPLRRRALCVRSLDGRCASTLSYRGDDLRGRGDRSLRARTSWNPRGTLATTWGWTRAALHAAFGHARGGWIGALVASALLWSGILAVLGFLNGFLRHRDVEEGIHYLHESLCGRQWSGPANAFPLAAVALPIWAAMFFVTSPLALTGAGLLPLSRERRAAVVWSAGLVQTTGLVLGYGAVLAVIATWFTPAYVVEIAAGQTIGSFRVLPSFVCTLFSIAIFAPLAQGFRLRFVEEPRSVPALGGTLAGFSGGLLALPAIALTLGWTDIVEDVPLLVQLPAGAALACASQGLWRAYLARHFAARDLAA